MSKPLLDTKDPKYLRRLVREVNKQLAGVWGKPTGSKPVRGFGARLKDGEFQLATLPECSQDGTCWVAVAPGGLWDPYGENVVASRERR